MQKWSETGTSTGRMLIAGEITFLRTEAHLKNIVCSSIRKRYEHIVKVMAAELTAQVWRIKM